MIAEVKMLNLQACAAAWPEQLFAAAGAGESVELIAASRAEEMHDLAGIGKVMLGLTLAHLGEGDEGFLEHSLRVTDEHRQGARTGTLRLMSADLELSVDDALNLVLSTGDGACVLALLDFAESEGVDLLSEARGVASMLGLGSMQLSGVERGESWGEGLLGETTPAQTLRLLRTLGTPAELNAESANLSGLSVETRHRVQGWMSKVFEPAGLAAALPGFGPYRVPHQTVSGWEVTARGLERGYSSVLSLPTESGEWVHVAAHLPASSAGVVSARDASAVLGSLGLSAYRASGMSSA